MKRKIFTLLFGMTITVFSLSAQTIKDNIDKQAKDKSTMDRAAKADVLIHNKPIYDPVTTISTNAAVVNSTSKNYKKIKKIKYKKHRHKRKIKTS